MIEMQCRYQTPYRRSITWTMKSVSAPKYASRPPRSVSGVQTNVLGKGKKWPDVSVSAETLRTSRPSMHALWREIRTIAQSSQKSARGLVKSVLRNVTSMMLITAKSAPMCSESVQRAVGI